MLVSKNKVFDTSKAKLLLVSKKALSEVVSAKKKTKPSS
jgi:hypothetical protein